MALLAIFVQGVVVARLLGPRAYGLVSLIATYPTVLLLFADARSSEATVKFVAESIQREEPARALAVCSLGYVVDLALALLAFAVVLVTAGWAGDTFAGAGSVANLIILFSAGLVLRSPAANSKAVLASFGRFKLLGVTKSLTQLVRLGLVAGAAVAGMGITGVIWASAAAMALEGAGMLALAYPIARTQLGGRRTQWSALQGHRREIARFLLWSDVEGTLAMIGKQVDVLILGFFNGPTAAGYYRLARSGASLGLSLISTVQTVVYPRLARLPGRGDTARLKQSVRAYALGAGLPMAAAVLATIPFIPAAIKLAAGPSFLPAVPAAQVLVAAIAVLLGLFWVRPLLYSLGETKYWAINTAAVTTAALCGFVALAPGFGPVGVAWTQLAVTIAGHGAALWYLNRPGRLESQPHAARLAARPPAGAL